LTERDDRIWTILELLNEAAAFFGRRGIESPRVNAETLLGHTLSLSRVELYARFDTPVGGEALGAFRELVRRRLARVPLQYLTGSVDFYSRRFAVREGVFIPRPETEVLVGKALEALAISRAPIAMVAEVVEATARTRATANGRPLRFAEIGVGSGVILLSALLECPDATGVGIDVSPEALELTRQNAELHGLAPRVELRSGSLFAPLTTEEGSSFDLLVANPPYLADGVIASLEPEVRDHEPLAALASGPDGLEVLRVLAAEGWRWLAPQGVLALEIGDTQGPQVLSLLAESGRYDDITLSKDYAGKDRVVVARKRGV
jgi:release factor glutamine methyltransferase